MDDGNLDRGDAGAPGLVAAGGEGTPAPAVHAGTGRGLSWGIPDGLLGPERRKTGWMRAEAAGDPAPGVNRRCSVVDAGTPTPCATWCGTMPWRPWPTRMRFWFSTRPASSSGEGLVRRASPAHRLGRHDHHLSDRRVRDLRLAARSCVHRSGFVTAQDYLPKTTCPRPGPRIQPGWPPPMYRWPDGRPGGLQPGRWGATGATTPASLQPQVASARRHRPNHRVIAAPRAVSSGVVSLAKAMSPSGRTSAARKPSRSCAEPAT